MVTALDRKLWRNLWALRGQCLAIAGVLAAGIAVFVMSLAALGSLQETRRAYYERAGFADVFVRLERAPLHVTQRLAALDDVLAVEVRIVREVVLDVSGFSEPVTGRLISLPSHGPPLLNRPLLSEGRLPAAGALDEVVLLDAFAQAHGLRPGARLAANLNGKRRMLTVVGTASSPEYVYALPPGALIPDDARFGVGWTSRDLLEAAFDMDGAFDDASLRVARGASLDAVIQAVDLILDPYGGIGAVGRADQLSNWFLDSEIRQLTTIATVMPAVFIAVAVFLLHMATSRLVALDREQIGLLKAFGYRDRAVAWHYLRLALAIALLGSMLGLAAGWWLGWRITVAYADVFRFPFLTYGLSPLLALVAIAVSALVAALGALAAVARAVRLVPAAAMRPAPPPHFARHGGDAARHVPLDALTMIILRRVVRWPVRSLMTMVGIAAAIALLVVSLHWMDSIDALLVSHFELTERQDVTVVFAAVTDGRAVEALRRLPGVRAVEPLRSVPVELEAAQRRHRGSIEAVPSGGTLLAIRDVERGEFGVTTGGLVIGDELARKLGVAVGDRIRVRLLQGRRTHFDVEIAAIVTTFIGTPAYLPIERMNALAGDGDVVSGARLLVDGARREELFRALKETAAVAAVSWKDAATASFEATLAETIQFIVAFYIGFAGLVAFGAVYTSARIALSERARELASLRVLGFTRGEISYVLLGELALLMVLALAPGLFLGYGLALVMSEAFDNELYRTPLVIEPSTYGLALCTVLAATALAALLVRRRVDRLDLIAVLKTRE